MKSFDDITLTAFFLLGTSLLYAIWLRLFWIDIWWGIDFTLLTLSGILWAVELAEEE